ncbi:MAG TPA: lantibiotic dehydratase [Thermoanaerobaculia bacterium]|jgi:thiopeptide-type bacteriocin biosynthesis protein|nr:lantibiotic dehydratase [Thermoanaerobaculia bacterium]
MKDFIPSGLVVMRTPLLPIEELEVWSAELLSPQAPAEINDSTLDDALTHDRALLRARLQLLIERPEIAEAIFLASPDLAESIEQWRREPESKKGKRTEQGLLRYFLRMVTRPTPFGLFSGCTAGRVGERTRLALTKREAYRPHSRLDMDYLFALCEHLARDPEVRDELLFRPNSSLYEAAGRLRFAEARVHGRLRTYHLVAFDAFDALRETLQRAAEGARLWDLAAALVASDPEGEITLEDAQAFLHDLVDNQLLVSELRLPVTGEEATAGLLRQLDALRAAGDVRARLTHAERTLFDIDAAGVGSAGERYRELARELEPLGIPVELSRLFQVDLMKPASEVVIGEPVIAEMLRGVEILHRFSRPRFERSLDDFRGAFVDRYGSEREVPLLDVLDEESGIGFERSGNAGAEASPLLSGIPFQRRGERTRLAWGNGDAVLLQLVTRALAEGRSEISLNDDDVKRMENSERSPLPDAFHVMAVLAAGSSEAVERGDFRLLLHGGMGPSGARMLGRFCHVDDAIREGVAKHVAAEEALRPGAVFAEIVHLPAGRLGNILARPVLREYEIPFLGRSGAPRDRQILLDDLVVTVSGDQIRLRSRSLDREVIPRLSTAHNTTGELGVYRFLAALQRAVGLQWDWGALDAAPFLPRVVSGRVVLSRARWRVNGAEIRPIASASGAARYRLAQRFREEHRMPRYVVLSDGDNELLVDFENALAFDAVIDLVRKREEITLTELFPAPDELCAEGPEGRFFHELIVPFTRRPVASPVPVDVPKVPSLLIARTFPPGSEWLYAKLYTGTATADRVLCEELAPLAAEAVASGAARRWFFIRYADPNWHLRVRFQGDPTALRERVQPALEAMAQRLVDAGAVWKVQFDTYEREVERYGGPEAIELAEEIFYRDSEAVVAMLESCSGDAGADLRWHLMLAGIDRLYADFGFDLAGKLRLAERSRDAFGRQFQYESLRDRLADRFRGERKSLARLLDGAVPIPALDQRSTAITPIARELLTRRLHSPINAILPSIIHMFVNRLSRSAGPEHELVLYDYLVQLYRSRVAREGKEAGVRVVAGMRDA